MKHPTSVPTTNSTVNLVYVHPITNAHLTISFDSVETVLLVVKRLRRHFKATYKLQLKVGYFTYGFHDRDGDYIVYGC